MKAGPLSVCGLAGGLNRGMMCCSKTEETARAFADANGKALVHPVKESAKVRG